MPLKTLLPALLSAALLAGCQGKTQDSSSSPQDSSQDSSSSPQDSSTSGDSSAPGDSSTSGDSSAPGDSSASGDSSAPGDSQTGDSGSGVALCDDGVPALEQDLTASGGAFDELVGNFTIETLDGSWTLSDHWTGCDSYMFLNFHRDYAYPQGWFSESLVEWLLASPSNAHYFFSSYETDSSRIREDVEGIQDLVESALSRMSSDEASHWRDRIHYSLDSAWYLEGGIGTLLQGYGAFHLGVDRQQVLREQGYMADPSTSWTTYPLSLGALELDLYNFEAQREEELANQGATVIRAFDAEPISDTSWAGVRGYADITLPDAKTMAGFDTLELDLTMGCGGHPEPETCPEWDYLVYAYLCDRDNPDDCSTEFGRWITTYARAGRWVVDASHFLAELQDGGERRVAFYTTQAYDITLDLRLYNQGKGSAPVEAHYLWSGGSFSPDYNSDREVITFTPPADAVKVELVAVVSGHGYSSDDNYCGEFCNHEHAFRVNGGSAHTLDHPEAGTQYGCTTPVSEGVIPNQYGTWVYGRGGWCPGWQVDPWTVDITSEVTLGAENTLEYEGLFAGADPTDSSTDARIDLTSWLVYSR